MLKCKNVIRIFEQQVNEPESRLKRQKCFITEIKLYREVVTYPLRVGSKMKTFFVTAYGSFVTSLV